MQTMNLRIGQRVIKISCRVPCNSEECREISVGSVGVVTILMDKNRTAILWEHRPQSQYAWWVWNHGISTGNEVKLYTEL